MVISSALHFYGPYSRCRILDKVTVSEPVKQLLYNNTSDQVSEA